jgi:glutaminyl-peptide cyclotransferase
VRFALVLGLALPLIGPPRVAGFLPAQPVGPALPVFTYTVVRSYPHDPAAFTQGLQYVDGFLYEGTGNHGASSLRKVRLETGEVLQKRDLQEQYFGEGIVVLNDEIVQLTYQTGIGFVYDRQSFAPKRTFKYQGEGWGLTEDGTNLIMSDGTDRLRVLDRSTMKEIRRIPVTAAGTPVKDLNELERVKSEIFANIWMTDYIARIDPRTGHVTGWVDLRGLLPPRDRAKADVLNGIAYDAANDRLFVTGKWGPRLFEITLVARGGQSR